MGSDRNRSITPVFMSVTSPTVMPGAVWARPIPNMPADQVLAVVSAARQSDHATEHVGEHQYEDDRLKVTSASVSGSRLIRAMLRLVSTHTSLAKCANALRP